MQETPSGFENPKLIVSFYGWFTSVVSSTVAYATQSNIAWGIGIIAGVLSIYGAILTIKDRKLSIKKSQIELKKLQNDQKKDNSQ